MQIEYRGKKAEIWGTRRDFWYCILSRCSRRHFAPHAEGHIRSCQHVPTSVIECRGSVLLRRHWVTGKVSDEITDPTSAQARSEEQTCLGRQGLSALLLGWSRSRGLMLLLSRSMFCKALHRLYSDWPLLIWKSHLRCVIFLDPDCATLIQLGRHILQPIFRTFTLLRSSYLSTVVPLTPHLGSCLQALNIHAIFSSG